MPRRNRKKGVKQSPKNFINKRKHQKRRYLLLKFKERKRPH